MKITLILPDINSISGGPKSTFEFANRLQDRGHGVSIVYPLIPLQDFPYLHNLKGIAKRALGTIRNLKNANKVKWFDLRTNLVRVPTLNERWIPKGDVVVATWWETAYYVNSYGEDKGEKFYFIRGYETWGGPEDLVNNSYTLPLYKVATSTWLKKIIEEKFNVHVFGPVLNGLNADSFYRENNGFTSHNPKRIGILYRRDEVKGIKDGLLAFLMVKEKFPDIQLVLFGEEPANEDLKIMERIKDIEFHRLPYKERLRKIYNSLDIFVFPSHSEGFGNPPMEAMGCGIACVATNVGAIPDYTVPGKTVLCVPPKSSGRIADAVILLLKNEDKRRTIAEAGFKYIKQFTWKNAVEKLEKIFTSVVNT